MNSCWRSNLALRFPPETRRSRNSSTPVSDLRCYGKKPLGDLPNWPVLKYLRPLGFQGNFGYLPAIGGHTSHLMTANQVIEYSFPYLSNNVQDIGLRPPFRNLFLFSEFNYSQLVSGPSGQTFPQILMTPGIAYVGYHFELSVGTQLALNNAARPGTHAVVLGLLDIFYDLDIPAGKLDA